MVELKQYCYGQWQIDELGRKALMSNFMYCGRFVKIKFHIGVKSNTEIHSSS
jgi:hypothetical protein